MFVGIRSAPRFRLEMSVWFWILIWNLRVKCPAYVKHPFFHIRNISRTRKYLSVENTKTLVHAFVTCRLDNGNALLYGLLKYLFAKLQIVLNCAARLILMMQKYDHATPLLIQFHWLPVSALFLRCCYWHLRLLMGLHRRIYDLHPRVYWRFLDPILSMATDPFLSVHQHFEIACKIIWDLQLTYVLLSVISLKTCLFREFFY